MTDTATWSEWVWVTTESQLTSALKRGYAGPASLVQDFDENDGAPLKLVRGDLISSEAVVVRNLLAENGRPVSVAWNASIIEQCLPGGPPQEGIVWELQSALPLVTDSFRVGLEAADRLQILTSFDPMDIYFKPLLSHSFVDPRLTQHLETVTPETVVTPTSRISPDSLDYWEREERLQCAVELCLAVMATEAQAGVVAATLSRRYSSSSDSSLASTLQEIRFGGGKADDSLMQAVGLHLLSMPTSVIADPLNDRQKIRLLELVLSNNLEPNDKGIFTKALSSLSNGDFLDLAEVASLSEEAQGLFLFLSHNVPQRVLEIDASYYEGVSEGAVIACAFLAGLRFRRQLVPLDRVVIPVRDHHVMRSIHTLNALSSALPEPSVSVDKNSIVLNGHRIERASEFYVLDFIDGSVSVIASHIVNDRKQLELHKGVLKVVVRGRAQVSRVAAKVQWRPRRDYESQLAESLFYECRKSRFSLKLFSNRSIEPFMEEVPVLEISFTDDVWIVRPQETLHLVKPVLTFRNSPDRPFLGLSDKKPKKVDVRRRFMPQRLSLS